MNRLALFTAAVLVLVAIGSQPAQSVSLTKSINSMCRCVPARVALIFKKSAPAKTQARATAPTTTQAALSQ